MAPGSCLACGSGAGGGVSSPRAGSRGRRLPKRLPREQLEELCEQTKLTPKEVRALYSRFRRLAPSGTLSNEQFRQTMGVLGLGADTFLPDRMFKVFDADQDDKLSFQEFATSLAVMIRGTEDEKLKLSFEMTAGRRGASGITMEDFQRLIQACNAMMTSIMEKDRAISKEDIERLFHELSSDEHCEGGEESDREVITLEAYKAAAQHDEAFLQCLGLKPNTTGPHLQGKRSPVGTAVRQQHQHRTLPGRGHFATLSPTPAQAAALAAGLPPGHCVVTQAQLEELKLRVQKVNVMLQHQEEVGRSFGRCLASSPVLALSASEPDEDERWWTPLQPFRLSASASGPLRAPNHSMSLLDEVCAELDHVLGFCSSAESGPDAGVHNMPTGATLTSQGAYGGAGMSRQDSGGRTPTQRTDANNLPLNSFDSSAIASRRSVNVHRNPNRDHYGDPTASESAGGGATDRSRARSQSFVHGGTKAQRQRKKHRLLGPKKGLAVHFGHENWNMVLSMMIGIRMAVGRSRLEIQRELQPVDFVMKEKFSIIPRLSNIFDSAVSQRVQMTRFIDYAPMVFQRIRTSFGIHHEDYLRSVGPEQLLGNMVLGNLSSLSELSSEGKSGAFFYYTADGNYMLKTVTPKEYQLLRKMLKQYHDHIFSNSGTLLVRFLGLHCLSVRKARRGLPCGKSIKKLYFVVMANMFNMPFEIHRRYDLKGSWVGRQTPPEKYDPSVALKDVDFQNANECIRVGEERKNIILKQIESDSAFLAALGIIDYSLLLGIHELSAQSGDGQRASVMGGLGGKVDEDLGTALAGMQDYAADPQVALERPLVMEPVAAGALRGRSSVSGPLQHAGWPASPASGHATAPLEAPLHRRDSGGMLSQDKKCLYFFGVIDILTPYDTFKVFEHHVKGLRYDSRGVSCCPPQMYAERFSKFMRGAFA